MFVSNRAKNIEYVNQLLKNEEFIVVNIRTKKWAITAALKTAPRPGSAPILTPRTRFLGLFNFAIYKYICTTYDIYVNGKHLELSVLKWRLFTVRLSFGRSHPNYQFWRFQTLNAGLHNQNKAETKIPPHLIKYNQNKFSVSADFNQLFVSRRLCTWIETSTISEDFDGDFTYNKGQVLIWDGSF